MRGHAKEADVPHPPDLARTARALDGGGGGGRGGGGAPKNQLTRTYTHNLLICEDRHSNHLKFSLPCSILRPILYITSKLNAISRD